MSADGMIWSAEMALQQSFLTALQADPNLQALLGNPARIFDDETEQPAFPHVVLEAHTCEDRGASGVAGQSHTLTLAVRSRDGGRAAVKEIIGALRAACEGMELMLSGQRVVLIQPLYGDAMRTPDLREFRGLLRIRIITEEAA
ncbi:DUF3168 domain-containing protein [Henriciella sp. AS95]|uniref:DUF3168 domain-containing protein n=1 Tax=Henriciella sp. AS95 TaxID=3135782 RepID=UPI003173F2BB